MNVPVVNAEFITIFLKVNNFIYASFEKNDIKIAQFDGLH